MQVATGKIHSVSTANFAVPEATPAEASRYAPELRPAIVE